MHRYNECTYLLISQRVEGMIGYHTAKTAYALMHTPAPASPLVSWDSGGGSFQICDGQNMFGRPMGSLTSFKALLAIQNRKADGHASGNPATIGQCIKLRDMLEDAVGEAPGG